MTVFTAYTTASTDAPDAWTESSARLPYRLQYVGDADGYRFRVVYWRTWRRFLPALWRRCPRGWNPANRTHCEPPL